MARISRNFVLALAILFLVCAPALGTSPTTVNPRGTGTSIINSKFGSQFSANFHFEHIRNKVYTAASGGVYSTLKMEGSSFFVATRIDGDANGNFRFPPSDYSGMQEFPDDAVHLETSLTSQTLHAKHGPVYVAWTLKAPFSHMPSLGADRTTLSILPAFLTEIVITNTDSIHGHVADVLIWLDYATGEQNGDSSPYKTLYFKRFGESGKRALSASKTITRILPGEMHAPTLGFCPCKGQDIAHCEANYAGINCISYEANVNPNSFAAHFLNGWGLNGNYFNGDSVSQPHDPSSVTDWQPGGFAWSIWLNPGEKVIIPLVYAAYDDEFTITDSKHGDTLKLYYTKVWNGITEIVDYAWQRYDTLNNIANEFDAQLRNGAYELDREIRWVIAAAFKNYIANTYLMYDLNDHNDVRFYVQEGACGWFSTIDVAHETGIFEGSEIPWALELQLDEWKDYAIDRDTPRNCASPHPSVPTTFVNGDCCQYDQNVPAPCDEDSEKCSVLHDVGTRDDIGPPLIPYYRENGLDNYQAYTYNPFPQACNHQRDMRDEMSEEESANYILLLYWYWARDSTESGDGARTIRCSKDEFVKDKLTFVRQLVKFLADQGLDAHDMGYTTYDFNKGDENVRETIGHAKHNNYIAVKEWAAFKAAARMFEYFEATKCQRLCNTLAAERESHLWGEYAKTTDDSGYHYIAGRASEEYLGGGRSLAIPEGLLYYAFGGLMQNDPDWNTADYSGKLGEALRVTAVGNFESPAGLGTPTGIPKMLAGQDLTWLSKTFTQDVVNSRAFNYPPTNSMYYGENTYWSFRKLINSGLGFVDPQNNQDPNGAANIDCLTVYPRGIVSWGLIREPKAMPSGTYLRNCPGASLQEGSAQKENSLLEDFLQEFGTGSNQLVLEEAECADGMTRNCQATDGCWGVSACSGGTWGSCQTNAQKCADGICRKNCSVESVPQTCTESLTTSCITSAGAPGIMMCISGEWTECDDDLYNSMMTANSTVSFDEYYEEHAPPAQENRSNWWDAEGRLDDNGGYGTAGGGIIRVETLVWAGPILLAIIASIGIIVRIKRRQDEGKTDAAWQDPLTTTPVGSGLNYGSANNVQNAAGNNSPNWNTPKER